MRVALAQLNLTVGDVAGNTARVADAARRARDDLRADLVVFPELTLTGYPPEDLLLHAGLYPQLEHALAALTDAAPGIAMAVGFPERTDGALYNVAALIAGGRVVGRYRKRLLPNYAVFDEKRYFAPGDEKACIVPHAGIRVALTICEDLWFPDVARDAAAAGAELIVNLSASPFRTGRQKVRSDELQPVRSEHVFAARAREAGLPVVTVNLVGGQDELVFDGGSLAVAADGTLAVRASSFEEALVPVDFERADDGLVPLAGEIHRELDTEEAVWRALVLGTRDYARKNGFTDAVLGLSGGIDSALCAAIAADAFGAARVHTVMMPSRYTSDASVRDAAALARALGTDHRVLSIEPAYGTLLAMLEGSAADPGLMEQNLQSRSRGVVLMALSNRHGWLVLSPGNKSEYAAGYSTLYGDMVGGFAPIKDLTKTMVYRLARWHGGIPAAIVERAPTAELAPGQLDQDSLPPYDVLDRIIVEYVEKDRPFSELLADGFDEATLRKVVAMLRASEYKRRQAPPGVRVTGRAFGRDRRYPITSAYRD